MLEQCLSEGSTTPFWEDHRTKSSTNSPGETACRIIALFFFNGMQRLCQWHFSLSTSAAQNSSVIMPIHSALTVLMKRTGAAYSTRAPCKGFTAEGNNLNSKADEFAQRLAAGNVHFLQDGASTSDLGSRL